MRTSEQLLNDLFELSPIQWNLELSKEYNMEYGSFIQYINTYEYKESSEDSIHHRISHIYDQPISPLGREPSDESPKVDITIRELSPLAVVNGQMFNQIIMCGFDAKNSDILGALIKGCVFRNCIFTGSFFTSSNIIFSKFIDCDFSNCDMSNVTIAKSQFYECVFSGAKLCQAILSDAILYKCQMFGCDLDDTHIITSSLHDCEIDNASLKRIQLLGGIVSYTSFENSNLIDANLFDMSVISIDLTLATLDGVILCDVMSTSLKIDPMYAHIFGLGTDEYADDGDENDGEGGIPGFDSDDSDSEEV